MVLAVPKSQHSGCPEDAAQGWRFVGMWHFNWPSKMHSIQRCSMNSTQLFTGTELRYLHKKIVRKNKGSFWGLCIILAPPKPGEEEKSLTEPVWQPCGISKIWSTGNYEKMCQGLSRIVSCGLRSWHHFVFSLDIIWHELYERYSSQKDTRNWDGLDCNLERLEMLWSENPPPSHGVKLKGELEWHQVISTIRGGLVRMIPPVLGIYIYICIFKGQAWSIGIWVNVRIFLFILDYTKHSKTQMLNLFSVFTYIYPPKLLPKM